MKKKLKYLIDLSNILVDPDSSMIDALECETNVLRSIPDSGELTSVYDVD